MRKAARTVFGDSSALAQVEISVFERREISHGELFEELGRLPVGFEGERLVVLELDPGESRSGEDTTDARVA